MMYEEINKSNVTNNENETNPTNEHKSNIKEKKKMRLGKFPRLMTFLLAGALILGSAYGAGYGTANLMISNGQVDNELVEDDTSQPIVKTILFNNEDDDFYISPVTAIAEAAGPSIVTVISTTEQVASGIFSNQVYESEGTGSGVIYKVNEDGVLIITNNHVIENAKEVSIILDSGITFDGEVIGFDTSNDLALVKVSNNQLEMNGVEEVTPAIFGDSENILPGELAVAIGNPMGKEFSQTVTAGVISAVDRELDIDNTQLHVIQTDAAINPGNSGGGLFNKNGEIIGINTAKLVDSSVEGMGFAIPIHIALPIIEKIESIGNGENIAYIMDDDRAYMGILMDSAVGNGMNFGVYVKEVVVDGPADQGNLKANDLIVALDGKKVTDSEMLYDALTAYSPSDVITLGVFRDEQVLDIQITLGRYGDYKEE